ncbi:DNA-binding transcriptional regulator, FadR family [Polaromonas sp. OV174]|uniref:FadR/GntR family transcriptional regulator n=1 Tax=Polaromonas sp. OV174 TaxID=1855300 RepID=UPI0008F0C527|nr:FCD domain-containing protein [Polaromonas sp. OV174]SFC73852.1 DNA-binding transcriptional regulator, FadR family [Polaromonas sp. OV174]
MNNISRIPAQKVDIDGLVETLRQRIAEGKKLPAERALGEELNVNRHTLRKALLQLRASGELASGTPRRHAALARGGAALARDTNPLEVIELRLALEPILARLAALRATPLDIARIEKAATTLAETESAEADLNFHRLIAAATRNTLAADIYALLRQIGADSRLHVQQSTRTQPATRLRQRDSEHHVIAAAIAARDPDAAEKAMRAHLHMVQCQILDRISLNPSVSNNS